MLGLARRAWEEGGKVLSWVGLGVDDFRSRGLGACRGLRWVYSVLDMVARLPEMMIWTCVQGIFRAACKEVTLEKMGVKTGKSRNQEEGWVGAEARESSGGQVQVKKKL